MIIIKSLELKIKNLKLFDLKTQSTLIKFSGDSLHLDNLILRDI